MTALRLGVGLAIVLATAWSMAAAFVMPRGRAVGLRLVHLVGSTVRGVLLFVARAPRSYARKDSVLAAAGPVALFAQLAMFLAVFTIGYGIALWPYVRSFDEALILSASQVFSAGLAHVHGEGNTVIDVLAAATGAVAIALQIGYLPAIYQAFNRREALVTRLEGRAGIPSWGPELLMRHQLVGASDSLASLYRDWEEWAADLAESHVSYPVLLLFRSPEPGYSFVLSLLAVLDAAALQLSLSPSTAPVSARFCLRMGFTALRRIGDVLGMPYDPDPLPEGPIQLSYAEFSYAAELMSATGLSFERSAEEAWPDFQGWRVNYESLAYALADGVAAPPAPWSGPRRDMRQGIEMPKRPPHRAPGRQPRDISVHRPPV